MEPFAKARRSACRRIARPVGGLHSEANISFHPFYKHCFSAILTSYVATATHDNDCSPPPRPGETPVGASPGPTKGFTMKWKFPSILFANTVLKQFPHLTRWRGQGPLHRHHGHASIRARSQTHCCCTFSCPFFPSQTMVTQHLHTPLWVYRADVDSTHQTLIGD